MARKAGDHVRGTVTRHEVYGFFMDIGEEQEGVVLRSCMGDDAANVDYPPIGSTVEAVLLGYTDVGAQPRLTIRPQHLAADSWPPPAEQRSE